MGFQQQLVDAVGTHRGTSAADLLCQACVDLLDVDAAAISLVFEGANTGTLGASSAPARIFDEVQFTLGEGPCLESVATRSPVLVPDLADHPDVRWPTYAMTMLSHEIRGVFAMPVVVAGEYVGALDLFRHSPGGLTLDTVAGAIMAAELAEMPLLDLVAEDLQAAIGDASTDIWNELNALTRYEVSQATGMIVAQLDVEPSEALVRLRAHAYATGRSTTDVSRDILARRLKLDSDKRGNRD